MNFEEKQSLKLWWLYLLLGMEIVIVSAILFLGEQAISMEELKELYFLPVLAIFSPVIIIYLIGKIRFRLLIDPQGISYSYFPFTRRKLILWEELRAVFLRKYDALGEYGGWGVRHRLWFKWKDKAYLFNDRSTGLQLWLSNGKKLLFSTNQLDELTLFLINLKQTYEIGVIETDVRERER